MKILLFANTDWFMHNFNRSIACFLRENGHDVVLVTPQGPYGAQLRHLGFRWIAAPMQRQSLNPFRELRFLLWLIHLLKVEKPQIVHNFTLKCVLLGSLAARLAAVPGRVNEITGLGYVYTSDEPKARFLRLIVNALLKISLGGQNSALILLNTVDFKRFERSGVVKKDRLHLVLGAGVDCDVYAPIEGAKRTRFRVLLPARMLWDKGIAEFVAAARLLRIQGKNIEFLLAGNTDAGNPTSIPEHVLQEWAGSGLVEWLGHVDDMRSLYHSVSAVVLPSYREGLPTSLTEAAGCGLPLIATNVPGCADVVTPGLNGLLVPVKDPERLAAAIAELSEDPDQCRRFGAASRAMALAQFDSRVILQQRLSIYRNLIPARASPLSA